MHMNLKGKNIMNSVSLEKIKPYRVLSLAGGGIRGLYTASILQSLANRFSHPKDDTVKDIGKGFDLIVGTSTGGILACGLVAGVSINRIIELYLKNGKKIFTNPFPINGVIAKLCWVYQNKNKSANSNKVLIQELQNIFGEKTMKQIYCERQISLCVTSVNVIDYSPRVFKTPHDSSKYADSNRKLADICLATSAAPIIFPIASIPDPERKDINEYFLDGSLWANDPVLVSLTEAITCSHKQQPIEIISIGTCTPSTGEITSEKDINRGFFGWKVGIGPMELSMNAQSKSGRFISDFLCKKFTELGKNISIHYLQQTSPSKDQIRFFSMDRVEQQTCSTLIKWGKKDGEEIYGKITRESNQNENVLKSIFKNLPNLKGGD